MNLYDRAKNDVKNITSNPKEFGAVLTFEDLSGNLFTFNGIHTKHHSNMDSLGNSVNAKNAHISFSEVVSSLMGMVIRNASNEVDITGFKVTVKDSTGLDCRYVIKETMPNETTGLIVCILGDLA